MSAYLCDQGKRAHLLDYMASLHECIVDLSTELLAIHHGAITDDEMKARCYRAATLAMDVQGDWAMIEPMLKDIYDGSAPVLKGL
jgi:hypothetical protein